MIRNVAEALAGDAAEAAAAAVIATDLADTVGSADVKVSSSNTDLGDTSIGPVGSAKLYARETPAIPQENAVEAEGILAMPRRSLGLVAGTPLAQALAATGGFRIDNMQAGALAGYAVASAGDVNADGFDDVIVGAPGAGLVGRGMAYVVFGKPGGGTIDLSAIAGGAGGFAIYGACANESLGISVAAAGDINGDGMADIIVGSPGYDGSNTINSGRVEVIYGGTTGAFAGTTIDTVGSPQTDRIIDGGRAQTIVTGAGGDVIALTTGGSIAYAGSGNDIISINADVVKALSSPLWQGGNDGQLSRIDGGAGIDTIRFAGTNLSFDLTLVANQGAEGVLGGSRLESIEKFDMTGGGKNTLKLHVSDVLDIAGINNFFTTGRHDVKVEGESGDTVVLVGGWTKGSAVVLDNTGYVCWLGKSALAAVYVETGLKVLAY